MPLINKAFDTDVNFQELNPQMKLIKPYSELYKLENSSKDMQMIFFLCDPDEDENKFARWDYDTRLKILKETFHPDFDPKNPLIEECLYSYPTDCLSAAERAFKEEKESLFKRAKFLKNAEYTFDDVERDAKGAVIFVAGKPMTRKGTADTLDKMRGYTLKIYQQYEEVEAVFSKEKEKARVVGGRKESLTERNVL